MSALGERFGGHPRHVLAWAVFAISVLVDSACRLRRVPVPRLPAAGPAQALASALIGTAVLGLLPGSLLATVVADMANRLPSACIAGVMVDTDHNVPWYHY